MKTNWYTLWYDDKKSMLATMAQNMAADITAGYDILGNSIRKQLLDMLLYADRFKEEVDILSRASDKDAQNWCRRDLKRRGVIE